MAKAPPAFQYYPSAFEQGTADLTLEEVGGYQRLLNHQWAHGSVPGDDVKRLAGIMRCSPTVAKRIWAVLRQKFVKSDAGNFQNIRLETERKNQEEFSKNQRARGIVGARKRWEKPPIVNGAGHVPAMAQASPDDGSVILVLRKDPPRTPPHAGGRRRRSAGVTADAEQIRKTQEVKRLIAEGLTFVDASRRVGFT